MKLQEVNIKELEDRFEMATVAENPSESDLNAPHHPDINPY